jgi:hypothetical protein
MCKITMFKIFVYSATFDSQLQFQSIHINQCLEAEVILQENLTYGFQFLMHTSSNKSPINYHKKVWIRALEAIIKYQKWHHVLVM